MKKVAIAMSGGVDSGVAAALLVREGYKCTGFHMRLWEEPASSGQRLASSFENKNLAFGKNLVDSGRAFINKCCSTESLEAARKTAHKLGIPFYIIDFEKIFKKRVVDYFLKEYGKGLTPNPCVVCNKYIKFGELLDYVKKLGYDYLATGHYARIIEDAEVVHRNFDSKVARDAFFAHGEFASSLRSELSSQFAQNGHFAPNKKFSQDLTTSFRLLMAEDKEKDQSYFLYNLTQKRLAQILFPVGGYLKKEVVAMAKNGPPAGELPVADRPESQEICFFPETDYRPFLKRQIREKIISGEVIDVKGRIIGKHQGLPLYTIGQRHGFILNSKFNPSIKLRVDGERSRTVKILNSKLIPPYYVIDKDVKKNQLIVGFGKEAERKEFFVKNINWINPSVINHQQSIIKCQVRIRHQGELLGARVQGIGARVKVILEEPERGITPGQSAVFYKRVKEREGERVREDDYEVLGGGIIV